MLTLWAAWLPVRPASRALEDVEGQSARLRLLRQSRRRRPRPPCGDDPVLWNAIQTNRRATVGAWTEDRLIWLVWIGLIALVTSWPSRVPAFRELARAATGAAALEAFTMPAWNPCVAVGDKLIMPADGPAAGQARLEFNIALRQVSAFWAWAYVLVLYGAAVEGVEAGAGAGRHLARSDRDPALRLGDPFRAKMLGPVLSRFGGALTLIALWTVGLMAGAVHPLGFLAAVTGLAALAWFGSALGVSTSLREGGMKRAGHPLALVVRLVAALGVTLLVGAISGALAWSSLLSYEDVFSVVHSGAFPRFGATALPKKVGFLDNVPLGARVLMFGTGALQTVVGARTVVAVWLAGTTALGAGAYSVTRAMCRDFDVEVGRPTRPRSDAMCS